MTLRSKSRICVRTFAGGCRLGTPSGPMAVCLLHADVVCYQAEFSAMDRSLVQGSSADFICHDQAQQKSSARKMSRQKRSTKKNVYVRINSYRRKRTQNSAMKWFSCSSLPPMEYTHS